MVRLLTELLIVWTVATVVLLLFIIAYFKWCFNYWRRRGLESLPPSIPFGNCDKLLLQELSMGEQFEQFYNSIKSRGCKHGGVYIFAKPIYVPVDPAIIKDILVKDFKHFADRGFAANEKSDPLGAHLVTLEGEKWKNLRRKLSPTFTSGKIKMMFETMLNCAPGLCQLMDEAASNTAPVDIKDVLGRFTTDVIGSCAFGIDCNSLNDPDAQFRQKGKRILEATPVDGLKLFAQLFLPKRVLDLVGFKMTKPDVEEFFRKIVHETIEHREKNNIKRNDFMQLLMQLRNGEAIVDGVEADPEGMTLDEITAQTILFFIAGFETSSTTMTFALYELAKNQQLQDKARSEIRAAIAKHGTVNYEAIAEMEYLERIINETLRKYPLGITTRVCTKDYIIPNTPVCIEEGTLVIIPVTGLCRDPDYYPEPDVFDPERFAEENKNKRPPCTWLGFGDGPRICIGMRFGMVQTKIGLVSLLRHYRFTVDGKTVEPLQFEKITAVVTAKGGIWLNVAAAP